MNKKKILGVYKWATMGGVERVLLNRAHAISAQHMEFEYDVFYFHDSGGRKQFDDYLIENKLDSVMKTVDEIDSTKYDYVLSIDTPEILDYIEPDKLFMECHTSYKKNRMYLESLPTNIKGVLVPSQQFKKELEAELGEQLRDKLRVLPNNVHINTDIDNKINAIYSKTPILYIGRLDILKNIEELIKIVSLYNSKKDDLFLVLAGPIIDHEINLIQLLEKYNMVNRTIYLPPVRFDTVWSLLKFVKTNRGIFMSASLNESFGLSVAEAMQFGIPVLALNNSAHNNLLHGDSDFLFETNQLHQTVEKLKNILSNYDASATLVKEYVDHLEKNFLEEWGKLFT